MNPYRIYAPTTVTTQSAFDSLLNTLPANGTRGGTVEFGCDLYRFQETISVPSYIRLEGSGSSGAWDRGTIISTSFSNYAAFEFKSTSNNSLARLNFRDCNGVQFLHARTRPCHDVMIERCMFYRCRRAVLFEATWQVRMNDVECIDCGTPDSPQIVLANSNSAQVAEAMIDSLRCEPMRGTGIWSDTRKRGGNVGMPVGVSCYGAMEFEGHHADRSKQFQTIVGNFYEGRFSGMQCRRSRGNFVYLGPKSRHCAVEGTFVHSEHAALQLNGLGHKIGSATIIIDENNR